MRLARFRWTLGLCVLLASAAPVRAEGPGLKLGDLVESENSGGGLRQRVTDEIWADVGRHEHEWAHLGGDASASEREDGRPCRRVNEAMLRIDPPHAP